jgi:transposase
MSTASETALAARPSAERGADRKLQAAALYADGQSTYEIGESFGVSATTIANWLNDLGIPRRPVAGAERLRELEQNQIRARRIERGLTRR